jgi:ABC-type dipeptide/oligopeptide/nickel transport system permease subunit
MMVTNWFLSFPFFLLALGIIAVRNPSISSVLLALVITGWAYFTRLLRGQVLGVRETEFVEAARAAGASSTRIMRKHVLPNSMAPVIVVAILTIGANITGEAGLSFLGLGVPPPDITWGNMAGRGQAYLELNPVEVLAPSFMIAFTLIAITLFGNALRDAADPKLKD